MHVSYRMHRNKSSDIHFGEEPIGYYIWGSSTVRSGGKSSKSTGHFKAEGTLEVHYIDVGQGDATLIKCGSHAMLIDGGNNNKGTTVQ